MMGTPSPRLSIMHKRLLPVASKFIGQRARSELNNSFRDDCRNKRLSTVMVFGMLPGEYNSSLSEKICKRIFEP
jgi:hypothetical protein